MLHTSAMSCEPSLIPPSNSQPSLSQPTSLTFDNILGEASENSYCFATSLRMFVLPTYYAHRLLWCLLTYHRYWEATAPSLQLPMDRYVWVLIEEGQTLNYRWLSGCCWLFLESKDRPDLFTQFEFSLGFVEKKRHHNKIFFALTVTVPVMNRSFLL